jgi:hypothetical protein
VSVVTAEQSLLEDCPISGGFSCSRDSATTYRDLATRSVSFVVECVTTSLPCANGQSLTQAWIAVYNSVALVEDPSPPAVEPIVGSVVAPGWHSGTEQVGVAASDASGVKALGLTAAGVDLGERQQACDYSRMQPCPPGMRATFAADLSKLPDGTHQLQGVAMDAADQRGMSTAIVLRVDQHAPAAPTGLAVDRNPDGTLALTWSNPDQGTAAPIVAAHYQVCDVAPASCGGADQLVAKAGIARLDPVALPSGEHRVRIWLQDEAGNTDAANAAEIMLDPSTVVSRRVVDTRPPVLLPDGPAPSPRLRLTRARRSGSTLTLSGTIARKATAALTAEVTRSGAAKPRARARTRPRSGKWTLRLRLTAALMRSTSLSLTLKYAGTSSYRKTTLHRRLKRRSGRPSSTATEFSVESRSARR